MADSVLERRGGVPVITWPAFAAHPVDVVVTTRGGGVSAGPYATLNLGLHVGDDPEAVVENRRRAAATVGADLGDLVFCRQTHGCAVATVTREDAGKGSTRDADAIDATDAVVTADVGVGLVMMAADCAPIVLYDPEAAVLGCVHSGWRGTTLRVAAAALGAMAALGARAERVVAAIGPAVPAARYQVGPEVVAAAGAALGDLHGLVAPDGTGRWTFDLVGANLRILTAAGVRPEAVHLCALDTAAAECFSDRAERPCGRQAAVAVLRR